MPPQIRAIIAVLSGVLLGYSVIYTFQIMGPYRPPSGIGLQNAMEYDNWVSTLPFNGYLYFLMSFLLAAFIGGALAALIALGTKYKIASLVTGFILLILAIGGFLAFNHPVWLSASACIGFLAFGWLGGFVVRAIFGRKKSL